MFIFGFGHTKSQLLGTIPSMDCPRCNNTSQWPIFRVKTYFSLFFIPIIPYKTQYLLACPVCRETREITEAEKDQFLNRA